MGVKAAEADPGQATTSWEQRARRAALAVEERHRAWHKALEERDALVVEGYEERPIDEVAAACLMTKQRVCQIVAARSATVEVGG